MYKLDKQEKNKFYYTIKITQKDWSEFLTKAYEKNKDKFSVQGFRKGKVPKKVVEQNYGAGVFFDEAFDFAISKEYGEILSENKEINPLASPEIKVEKFDEKEDIEISMIITAEPEVKLGEYKGLKIKKSNAKADEAKVDAEIEQIRDRQARFVIVERQAKMGDFVTIDFLGKVDGKPFDGGKAEDYRLELGSKSFIDTFEEQIAGMNIGEKRTIKVTFPENYTVELKNKPAEFEVTLNKVEEKQLPELNDEFASNVSEFDTFADFKADIKKHIQESLDTKNEQETENKLIETIVKNATVEIPEVMTEEQLEFYVKDFEMRLTYQGMKLEDYFNYTGTTMEQFKDSQRKTASDSVKTRLVLQEIIKTEKLTVKKEELDSKLQENASKFKKSVEDYKKSMTERELSYIQNGILMEKLINFLKTNNEIA